MVKSLLWVCAFAIVAATSGVYASSQSKGNCKQLLKKVHQSTSTIQYASSETPAVIQAKLWLEGNKVAIKKCEARHGKSHFSATSPICKQLLKHAKSHTQIIEDMAGDSFEARKATAWLKKNQIEIQECQQMKAKLGFTPADQVEQTHPGEACEGCTNSLIN